MTNSIRYPCQGRRNNIMYNLKTVTTMLEHEIKLTNDMVIERIVRETSLSEGDVKNALVSLSNVVCDALQLGMSVDLAELGSFRLVVPSKMMDTPAEVTVKDALKTPKIVFTPKQKMRDAANKVELSIDRGTVTTSSSGGTSGGSGEGNDGSFG